MTGGVKKSKAVIWVDGAARGNPGPAAIAAVIKDERGVVHSRIAKCIGKTTNNQAEYRALVAALEKAIELGANGVEVNSDSELMVRQVTGRYKVKNAALKPLHQRIKELQGKLGTFSINHIPREKNEEADRLVNKALDAPVD